MKSNIRIVRANDEDQAVHAVQRVQRDGFDISYCEGTYLGTTIFCNSDELLELLKGIFASENPYTVSYGADLARVQLDKMSVYEVESRLHQAFP